MLLTSFMRGQNMESRGMIDPSFSQLSSSVSPDQDEHTLDLAQASRLDLSWIQKSKNDIMKFSDIEDSQRRRRRKRRSHVYVES